MTLRTRSETLTARGQKLAQQHAGLLPLTAIGLGVAAALASLPASADVTDSPVLQEVTVTAQRREQRAQDVGISLTAFTSGQLRTLQLLNTTDISEQTPGMKVYEFSPALTVINIRGVSQNDFADHYEPPIAVFVDGAYVSAQGALDAQLLDMERVEVLRGPQGTLFGRNAIGGVIQYITRQPSDTFDAHVDLGYGSFAQKTFEAAVGGPISERLDGRVAVGGDYYDGWVKDVNGPPLNDSNSLSYRGQLLFKTTDDLRVLVNIHGLQDNDTTAGFKNRAVFVNSQGLGQVVPANVNYYGTCDGCDAQGYRDSPDPGTVDHSYPGKFQRSLVGTTAKVTWAPGPFTVTAISDYFSLSKLYESDSSASPFPVASYLAQQDLQQLSQELRISGTAGQIRWTAGAYYLYINAKQRDGSVLFGVFPDQTHYSVKTKSPAAFGQLDYDVSPTLTGTVGLRYTQDQKQMNYVRTGGGILAGTDVFDPSLDPGAEQTYRNYQAKLELDWKPVSDVLVYGAFNRGTKGGDFSAPLFPPVIPADLPHKQEVLYDYELGQKATLAHGRMTLDTDVFYYAYHDYQAFAFTNLAQTITNVNATVKGAELELHALPLDRLELALGVSLLDGTAKGVRLPDGEITDRDMPMSPSYGLNALAKYTVPLGAWSLALEANGNYTSHYYWLILNAPDSREPGYFVGNASFTVTSPGERWTLSFSARNLTNRVYRIYMNDVSSLSYELNQYAPPRWYSANFSYRWR